MNRAICSGLALLIMLVAAAPASQAGQRPKGTKYEVYYFHASWRCENCINAETWSREAVEGIAAVSGGNDAVEFIPIELGNDLDLDKMVHARRVDVAVVEFRNDKIIRSARLGNLLDIIEVMPDNNKARAAVRKLVTDGLRQFDAKAKTPWLKIP